MKVRDAERADVDIAKLRLYCLDMHHPCGWHKARQFESRLGMTAHDAEALQKQLLHAVQTSESAKVVGRDEHAQRYQLDVDVKGPLGTARVRTTWMMRTRDHGPRLATCFIL